MKVPFQQLVRCSAFILCSSFTLAAPQTSLSASQEKMVFDAVSIRQIEAVQRSQSPGKTSFLDAPHKPCVYLADKVLCQLSLEELIEEAYQHKRYEVIGPNWLGEDRFVFQAIVSDKASKGDLRIMMRNALEDRFGLRSHDDRKPIPVYEMVAARGGVHLEAADAPEARKLLRVEGNKTASLSLSAGNFSAVAITLDLLAMNVQTFADLDRPVLNGTGLEEEYKVKLHWKPTDDPEYLSRFKDPGILGAIRDQLGLVLRKRDLPVNVMVIDKVNRVPTPNP